MLSSGNKMFITKNNNNNNKINKLYCFLKEKRKKFWNSNFYLHPSIQIKKIKKKVTNMPFFLSYVLLKLDRSTEYLLEFRDSNLGLKYAPVLLRALSSAFTFYQQKKKKLCIHIGHLERPKPEHACCRQRCWEVHGN